MKIEVFEVDTESGRKRISMKSTGNGAWVTVTSVCANPLRVVHVRPVFWIARARDINLVIEKCTN
jgi:hypothetical protein